MRSRHLKATGKEHFRFLLVTGTLGEEGGGGVHQAGRQPITCLKDRPGTACR